MLTDFLVSDVNNFTTDRGIIIRRKISPFLKQLLRIATPEKIIVDNYPILNKNEPYIFASTHGFSNDIIACLASIDRSAYLLMGSTNQIEYNRLMYFAWLNGFIYVNRTDENSRKESVLKMERILKEGSSILMFPEGGHNNTESSLCNRLFSGPYILSMRTGCKVVPIAPFYEFGSKTIHINFGNPVDLTQFEDKKAANEYLRNLLATMVFENIEKYSTPYVRPVNKDIHLQFLEERKKEYLKNPWTKDAWEEELTRYLNASEKEYESLMKSMDNIRINKKNAFIVAPYLVERYNHKKYSINNYMHNNWNR